MKKPSHKTILNFFGSLIILEIIILIVINYSKIADYFFNEATKYNGELLKFVATAIGGILLFYGLWLNARRTKALEQQNEISNKGQTNERFKNAIEHLGSENPAIILGGIHALHRIAIDDPSFRAIVFNILCSYIRETSSYNAPLDGFIGKEGFKKPSIIIQTILDLLFGHDLKSTYVYESLDADLRGVNLEGADLQEAHLDRADLTGANLKGASLCQANLEEASLFQADLYGSDLEGSDLERSHFGNANLGLASLSSANLKDVFLSGANLFHAYLTNADLEGAILEGANLEGANLNGVNVKGANFERANFKSANFEGANLQGASFVGARFDGANLKNTIRDPNFIIVKPMDDIDDQTLKK